MKLFRHRGCLQRTRRCKSGYKLVLNKSLLGTLPVAFLILAVVAAKGSPFQCFQTNSPSPAWGALACSVDGNQIIYGTMDSTMGPGRIWLSTNSAGQWSLTATGSCSSLFQSADGEKSYAATTTGNVFISQDRGMLWSQILSQPTVWTGIACSGNGSNVLVGGASLLMISKDAGVTWQNAIENLTLSNGYFSGVAVSADGTTFFSATQNADSSGSIYGSTNGGRSWTLMLAPTGAPGSFWNTIACSANGQTVLAAGYNAGVAISTNSGLSWTHFNIPSATSACCSATGDALFVGDWNGGISASSDLGVSWVTIIPGSGSEQWLRLACSADGCRVFAQNRSGELWVLQKLAQPILNIFPAGNGVSLSWTIPSAVFLLESATTPNASVWQLSNTNYSMNQNSLTYEVSIPFQGSTGFFRLSR